MEPFRARVDESVVIDLATRLKAARWPQSPAGEPWAYGTSQPFLRQLVDFWLTGHDWRRWEARFAGFDQYIATIEGRAIHVLVQRARNADALPIILTHGWPGSVVEFLDVAEMLANPEASGGRSEDAFTVVLPSLPGYGFSAPPDAPFPPAELATVWHRLMTEALGFDHYVAHGSDWGSVVTSALGLANPAGLRAIHLTAGAFVAPWTFATVPLDQEEQVYIATVQRWESEETGYQAIQGTRPLTLSYALTDSPVGLAAWICEKFRAWTDREGSGPDVPVDTLIANITMHWIPGPGPATWMYRYLRDRSALTLPDGQRVEAETGIFAFPRDYGTPPPRRWLERSYNLRDYSIADRGGHFPGLEQPKALVGSLRRFFADYRDATQ